MTFLVLLGNGCYEKDAPIFVALNVFFFNVPGQATEGLNGTLQFFKKTPCKIFTNFLTEHIILISLTSRSEKILIIKSHACEWSLRGPLAVKSNLWITISLNRLVIFHYPQFLNFAKRFLNAYVKTSAVLNYKT